MKTAELTGALLDYWVARAEGHTVVAGVVEIQDKLGNWKAYSPSTSWAQGGPIIDREIAFLTRHSPTRWSAVAHGSASGHGETALVAAMRAVVHAKFGDEVRDATQ